MPRPSRQDKKNISPRVLKAKAAASSWPNLEDLLSRVLERDGITISVVSRVYQAALKGGQEAALDNEKKANFVQDTIRHLDAGLLKHVTVEPEDGPVPIPIRLGGHLSSQHVLTLTPDASFGALSVESGTQDEERTIPHWVAPFDEPPALETLIGSGTDLTAVSDPHALWKQFTPHNAEHAFAEQFGWWSKVRAPFVRWERKVERVAHEVKDRELELITEAEQTWHAPVLVPRLQPTRILIGFLALMLFVSLPAGAVSLSRSIRSSVAEVKSQGQLALADTQRAIASEREQATALREASGHVRAADEALTRVNVLALAAVQALPQTRDLYASTRSLLAAGEKSLQATELLAKGVERALGESTRYPDERLVYLATYLDQARPLLEEAASQMKQVNSRRFPAEVQSQLELLKQSLVDGQTSLEDLTTINQWLLHLIGHRRPRTYLLVFQNNAELRPTGGFMGSVAEIVVDRGEIKKIRVPGGGPYDLRSQLNVRVAPPKPLQLIASRWEFQDANWFPDFPAAAKKIRWFWSKAGQPTVDGVVAVNASLIPKLMQVTGPVEMPEYQKILTADTVLWEMQKAVELEYDKTENKPKKIIGDLMPKLFERMKSGGREEWLRYLALLGEALETKEIQLYLVDEKEQSVVEAYDWSGRLKPTDEGMDSLALVEANIAGHKTDTSIREQVSQEITLQEDGSAIHMVTLTRTHLAQKGELFRGENNVTYLRMYVPEGSSLLEAEGFVTPSSSLFKQSTMEEPEDVDVLREVHVQMTSHSDVTITKEFGRTAFGGWLQLAPGATSVTRFRYRVPAPTTSGSSRRPYTFLLTSQSGRPREIKTTLTYPTHWKINWMHDFSISEEGLAWQGTWDRDHVLSVLFDASYDRQAR